MLPVAIQPVSLRCDGRSLLIGGYSPGCHGVQATAQHVDRSRNDSRGEFMVAVTAEGS